MMLDGSEHRVTQDWVTDSSHFMNPLEITDDDGNPTGRTTSNDPVNIGLRNIVVHRTGTDSETGYAILNIYPNYHEGTLSESQYWSGDVYVGADVEIPSGVTLTIEQDASVYFLTPRPEEDKSSGDTGHSELIVQNGGRVVIKPGVVFRSANEAINSNDPITYEDESYGLYVMSGGKVTVEGLEVTDGTFYLYSEFSGRYSDAAVGIQLSGDVIVSGGETELRLNRSTHRRDSVTLYLKNNSDLSGTTPSDGKVGLVARQGALLNASDDILRPLNETPGLIEDSWAGIISQDSDSKVNLRRATLMSGQQCIASRQEGRVSFGATVFRDCGLIQDISVEEGNTEVTLSLAQVLSFSPLEPVEWRMTGGGDDRDKFSISGGILTFLQTPDFENPHDAGADNTFEVGLSASIGPSGTVARTKGSITVRVTDNPSEEPPEPEIGEPGEPALSKNDAATSDNLLSFTVTLTSDVTGSPIRTVFWRHTATRSDPDDPAPAETTPWKARTVEQDGPLYSSWFQSGREFTLDLVPDADHEIEVKVGHCDPSGPNASTCDALSEVFPEHESYFVWSQTATLTHASPAAPLAISGGQEIEYWEDYTTPINTFQTDAYSWETVTWSLDNTSHMSYFSISGGGELSFTDQRPAFDPAGTNRYTAVIRATTTRRTSNLHTFAVTLKEDSEGSVSITNSTEPRVGTDMTASVTDPDGGVNMVEWEWLRSMYRTGEGPSGGTTDLVLLEASDTASADYNPNAESRTLTPLIAQLNYRLFARATYSDVHGSEKMALHGTERAVDPVSDEVLPNYSGLVSFSYPQELPGSPRVGREIKATLIDRDGPIRNWTMTWERVVATGTPPVLKQVRGTLDEVVSSIYTPVPADGGSRLQVSVSYTDNFGPGQMADNTSLPLPANMEGVVTLTNQDPPTVNMRMTASLEDPDDSTDLTWVWDRVCPRGASPSPKSDHTYTPITADIGCNIRVTLLYDDAFANDNRLVVVSSGTTVSEPSVNTAPTIREVSKRSVTERSIRRDAGVYEATDTQNHALEWSLRGTDSEGTDHNALRLKDDPNDANRKTLEFRTSPNFEDKSSYSVEIKVTETETPGQLSGTFQRTVNVLNGPDPGYVTFSPDPPTACSSTTILLTDEDGGINSTNFQSRPHSPVSSSISESGQGTVTSSTTAEWEFTPGGNYARQKVSAQVRYNDLLGSNITATGLSGIAGSAIPKAPPSFTANGGKLKATLSWTAPDNCGDSITQYEYSYKLSRGSTWITGTTSALSKVITGLQPETAYDFRVRARNSHGYGPYSSASATTDSPDIQYDPVVSCTFSPVPENTFSVGGSCTATDRNADGSISSWDLDQASRSVFNLTPSSDKWSATLAFKGSHRPDFEEKSAYSSIVISVTDQTDRSGSTTKSVSITNVKEPGYITFSSSSPTACEDIDIILTDDDGGITSPHFTWSPESLASSVEEEESGTGTIKSAGETAEREITPSGRYARKKISARVSYGDNFQSSNNMASGFSGAVSSNHPNKPGRFLATGGVQKVSLSWAAPDNCGETIDYYEYRYKKSSSSSWTTRTVTTPGVTVSSLEHDTRYDFELRAHNGSPNNGGFSSTATADATTNPDPPDPPSLSDHSVTMDENTLSVGTFTATDPDPGDRITSWTSNQSSLFSLTPSSDGWSAALAFKAGQAPNYEAQSSYTVVITVTDATNRTDTGTISITVSNVNEPGTLTISPGSPKVGEGFTMTGSDEDGFSQTHWLWFGVNPASRESSGEPVERVTVPSLSFSTLATAAEVGKRIKGQVLYGDSFGRQSAVGYSSGTIQPNTPEPPRNFSASRGSGTVSLSWSTPRSDRGATVTRYDYRHRVDGGQWTTGNTTGLSKDFTGLTNGSLYHFEVAARNSVGLSSWVSVSATPAGVPDAPSGITHSRTSASVVTLSWNAPSDNGSSITEYHWRHSTSGSFAPHIYNTVSTTSFTHTNSSGYQDNHYSVRSRNGVGNSSWTNYTVYGQEFRTKPVADFADSTGFGVRTAPNPFNGQTVISLALPEDTPVTLTVHSVTGQTVSRLYDGDLLSQGLHTVEWSGRDDQGRNLGSGIYLFRLVAGSQVRLGKLALIR